jgi:hypothetical protein
LRLLMSVAVPGLVRLLCSNRTGDRRPVAETGGFALRVPAAVRLV